jgi:hypothetical protein
MKTDDKIVALARAIRLLAWHVDRLSKDNETSAELREIRDSMQRLQRAPGFETDPATAPEGRRSPQCTDWGVQSMTTTNPKTDYEAILIQYTDGTPDAPVY